MTTLTDKITQELLDAANGPGGLEDVLKKYKTSKGPLYGGLAQATAMLIEKLSSLSAKCKEAEEKCQERQEKIKTLEKSIADLNKGVEAKIKELASLDDRVKQVEALIDQAKALGGLGFGLEQLTMLHDQLAHLATSQGAKPEEAVAFFFQEIDGYQSLVSLELEARRAEVAASKAKAELERWQAEAKAAEAKAKARKTSIDFTDKLLVQGIKQGDLPQWSQILTKAGMTPELLAQELEQFGSLQKLYQERQQQAQNLENQAKALASQVKALSEERQQVSAAIGAVREKALAGIETASKKTLENINLLMNKAQEYGELERQAGKLFEELDLARALKSLEPGDWAKVSRQSVRNMLAGLGMWTRSDASHNLFLPPPPSSISSSILYVDRSLRLEGLLRWALSAVFTEEERRALASGW